MGIQGANTGTNNFLLPEMSDLPAPGGRIFMEMHRYKGNSAIQNKIPGKLAPTHTTHFWATSVQGYTYIYIIYIYTIYMYHISVIWIRIDCIRIQVNKITKLISKHPLKVNQIFLFSRLYTETLEISYIFRLRIEKIISYENPQKICWVKFFFTILF